MSLQNVLYKLCPKTDKALIDRFVPFLAEAMPRYEINTAKRQAAFLATVAYESQYFQKTKEGLARKGTKARAYQDKYWSTGFYGRGLIQLTHEPAYVRFTIYIHSKWADRGNAIEPQPPVFSDNPSLVEQPQWAVESACWYWIQGTRRNLNLNADKDDFFGIQGLVNRGDSNKKALDYETREKLYNRLLALLRIENFSAPQSSSDELPSGPPSGPPSANTSVSASTADSLPVAASSSDSPSFLDRIRGSYGKVTSWFDKGNEKIIEGVQRKDAAKSTWSLIGGGITHAFWALVAFFLGIPKELYLTVAIIGGILLIIYLIRQVYLGGIREKRVT